VPGGTAAHAGQAAGTGGRAQAAAIVGDVEGDKPVLPRQGNADGGGVGVAGAVGQGLAGDGEDVVGQRLVRALLLRAGETEAGREAELGGVLFDEFPQPGGQASRGMAGPVEPEDAGPDLLDYLIEGVDVAVDPCRGFRVGAGSVALQRHAEGEQFGDDMVVQVSCDPVVVFDLGQGELVGAGPGQFHGHGRVAGEADGQVQVSLGEARSGGQPAQQQRAADLLAGGQRDDDQRAGRGAKRGGGRGTAVAGDQAGLPGEDHLPGQRAGQRRGPVRHPGGELAGDADDDDLVRAVGHGQRGEVRCRGGRRVLGDQRVRRPGLAGQQRLVRQQQRQQLAEGVHPPAALLGFGEFAAA
jgi:hypothetical protein